MPHLYVLCNQTKKNVCEKWKTGLLNERKHTELKGEDVIVTLKTQRLELGFVLEMCRI